MTSPASGDRALALDGAAIVLSSVAIAVASDELALMTALVPAILAARMLLWSRLPALERGHPLGAELAIFVACIALGAFNDWTSVVRYGIYDYTVPVWRPQWTTIPLWMLLFWGMILRFVLTLVRWPRLGAPAGPRDEVRLGPRRVRSGALKVALELALVLGTRQAIYRLYADPVLSWLPFAVAIALFALLFGLDRHDRRLAALFLVGGPLVEMLYIHVGGLHRYHLGWIGGVPLWICLWWVLAVLVAKDLGLRLGARLAAARPTASPGGG